MATRSARLWQLKHTAAGAAVAYVCPANTVTILKHIALTNWSGSLASVSVWLQDTTGAVVCYLLKEQIAHTEMLEWSGWIVLEQGDTVLVTYDFQPVSTWGSGAELVSAY